MKLKTLAMTALLLPTILSAGLCDDRSSCFPSSHVRGSNQVFDHANHRIVRISDYGDMVEIEDGSIWRVEPHYWHITRSWKFDAPLTFTQNQNWFGNAEYRIINLDNNSSVEVRGHKKPVNEGPYTRHIRSINWSNYEIHLNDGSRWAMSPWDFMWMNRDWAHNDAVIIGVNSGREATCPAIIINANLNKFVRARQL